LHRANIFGTNPKINSFGQLAFALVEAAVEAAHEYFFVLLL